MGSEQSDMMQRITGELWLTTSVDANQLQGAFAGSANDRSQQWHGPAYTQSCTVRFDSALSPDARTGPETTGKNRAYIPMVKALK